MVLYCAADLLWATRIKGTAEGLGIPCRPVRNAEMLRARLADSEVRGLIVDLDAGDNGSTALEVLAAAAEARAGGAAFRVLAFGPHVATDLFEAARAAGADQVLARGAFDRRLVEILGELEAEE